MKRFVILTDYRGAVQDVVQCETTEGALRECQKYEKVADVDATWLKAASLEALAELDIRVQVWLLKRQIAELSAPVATWSNGRPKKR